MPAYIRKKALNPGRKTECICAKMMGKSSDVQFGIRFSKRNVAANWLIGEVVGVEKFNDRVMKVNIVIGDVVWEVVSCCCPQVGRSVNEKDEFYELIDKVVINKELVSGDFNDHVGSDMGGFGEVNGSFGID